MMQINPGAQSSKQKNVNLFSWFRYVFLSNYTLISSASPKETSKLQINVLSNKLRNTIQWNPHFLNQKPNENSDKKFFPLNLFDYTLLNPNIPNSEFLKLVLIPLKVRDIRIPSYAF